MFFLFPRFGNPTNQRGPRFFIKTNWFWMRWTIRIKQRSTSGIYDSELTCYNVVFIIIWLPNLMRAMHVYLTSTSSMCKTQWHATQWLSYSSWSHVGTWHMWRRCPTSLCGLITVTCCWFQKNVLVPPWAALAVHARSEDVHTRHAHTYSLARTRGYTGERNFAKIHPMW